MSDFMVIFFEGLISGSLLLAFWLFYLVRVRRSAEREYLANLEMMVTQTWFLRWGPESMCSAQEEKVLSRNFVVSCCTFPIFSPPSADELARKWRLFVAAHVHDEHVGWWRELLMLKLHYDRMTLVSIAALVIGLSLVIGSLAFLVVVNLM